MPAEPWAKARGSLRATVRAVPRETLALPRMHRRATPEAAPVTTGLLGRLPVGRLGCFMLIGVVLWMLAPRAIAYWRLHGAASAFANYASCMVGPTGHLLLRDRPGEFWQLVRRRLIAASADARPFAQCAALLDNWPERQGRAQAHAARAVDFVEYGSALASSHPTLSLQDLTISAQVLEDLSESAWPFSRSGYAELVQPARHAKAALHPVELARPERGRGLPRTHLGYSALRVARGEHWLLSGQGANLRGYRTGDGGRTWAPVEVDAPSARALGGRCSTVGGEVSFRLSAGGEVLSLESWSGGQLASTVPLGSLDDQLVAFACDEAAAIAIVREPLGRMRFRQCRFGEPCRALSVPAGFSQQLDPKAVLSAARVHGTDVLSLAHAGIVRVISSRDDGQSWTPPVVAYDHGEAPGAWSLDETPAQLLGLGERVLLYTGADQRGATYPVLASDDLGASFRALSSN